MKLYDAGLTVIIIVGIAIVTGLVSVKYLGDKNPVEVADEAIIKDETGISVDLTQVEHTAEAIVNEVEGTKPTPPAAK